VLLKFMPWPEDGAIDELFAEAQRKGRKKS
jgi:hypothetical protein